MLFHKIMDIIGRASAISAVQRILLFMLLSQNPFRKCGGLSDNGSHPHPEHRPCPSGRNRRNHTGQISHSHTGRGRDNQGLQTGNSPFFFFFRVKGNLQYFPAHPDRKNTGSYRKKNTGRNQNKNQKRESQFTAARKRNGKQISPQKTIDSFDKCDNITQNNPSPQSSFSASRRTDYGFSV